MLVFTMLWRDLRARFHDRSALVLALLAPAILMAIFAGLAGGPSQTDVPIGFSGPPGAPLTVAIRDGALVALDADNTIELTDVTDREALAALVNDGDVDAGIAVDGSGSIEVLHGSENVVANAIADAIAASAALTVDVVGHAAAAEAALGVQPAPDAIAAAILAAPALVEVVDTADEVGGVDYKTQAAAGMATFFLFFTVQFGVLGILEERREGTLARLLAAPVAPWQVLAAKVLVSFVIGIVSMLCLVVFAGLLLGAHWGSALGVGILIAAGVTAAVSTITLVVGVVSNPDQASNIQSMIALVLGLLGGAFFSMVRAGGMAAFVSRLTPHHWFNEGLVRLSGGASWTAALGPAAAMVAFAALFGVPGLLLASRSVRP